MIKLIEVLVVGLGCYLYIHYKLPGFLNHLFGVFIVGAISFIFGCMVVNLFHGLDVLRESILLRKFNHLRWFIVFGYLSFTIVIYGLIEKSFRYIAKKLI